MGELLRRSRVVAGWDDETANTVESDLYAWTISQFLHTEKRALEWCARLIPATQSEAARSCLALQIADESRHVAALTKYIALSAGSIWPESLVLQEAFRSLSTLREWDQQFLGMQVLIEGSALAALVSFHDQGLDPLLAEIIRYIISDEARHVALGVSVVQAAYVALSTPERQERLDLIAELTSLLSVRLRPVEVLATHGLNPASHAVAVFDDSWRAHEGAIVRKLDSLVGKILPAQRVP